jgi:tRNA(Ile)-lysidine synthase
VAEPAYIFRGMGGTKTACAEVGERLDRHLRFSGLLPENVAVTVALSGGLDSVVLLDLLSALRDRWGWQITAAHFDHRMREESESEANWVRDMCEGLEVPCHVGHARVAPGNETEARDLRYEFLDRARAALGADWLATAHHADDQAETVLFRLLRGGGLAGLAGIPARRSPGIVRPLLPFWRSEIEEYAHARGLNYLVDPSNLDLSITRNRIRHQLIPEIEAGGEPQFREQLFRLADLAGRAARILDRLAEKASDELVLEAAESRIVVARTGFLAYDTNVRAHLLRALVARVGPRPGRIGTRVALEFITTSSSGRAIDLAGGVVMRREFDRVIIERPRREDAARDEELIVPALGAGDGDVTIGGVAWRVRWDLGAADAGEADEAVAHFDPSQVRFPLAVRSWQPGDRIQLPAGTRKLKKVFGDRKVGRSRRGNHPVLVDRSGVLWIVGVVQGARAAGAMQGKVFSVWLRRKE